MKYERIGRTIMCLLLVCVLLVNISPIKAEASALGALASVEAVKVIGSALIGLGISYGVSQIAFETLRDSAIGQMISDGDDIVDDKIHLAHLGNGLYGIKESLLQGLFDWLYDSKVLSSSVTSSTPGSYDYFSRDEAYEYAKSFPYAFYYEVDDSLFGCNIYLSQNPLNFWTDTVEDGSTKLFYSGSGIYYVWRGQPSGDNDTFTISSFASDKPGMITKTPLVFESIGGGSITTEQDLTLNFVANPGASLATGYPAWHANSVSIPNAETGVEERYYPLAVDKTIEDTQTKTQEEVWVGIVFEDTGGSTEPTEPDTGEGTIPMSPPVTPSLLERLFGDVGNKIEQVSISIQEIPDLIREFAQDVKKGFEELPTKFAEWFNDIRTKLQQLAAGQITLADLLSGLFKPIRDAVVDALTYLFAPSETFIKSQVESLIAKYPTSNNLFMLGTRLGDFLLNLGQTPPVIYIDLGAAEGSFLLGGTVAFLDLTWYARYKGTVDGILGAFLWLLFAWRVWLKLPGIIGGASGTIGSILSRKEDFNDN